MNNCFSKMRCYLKYLGKNDDENGTYTEVSYRIDNKLKEILKKKLKL